MEPVELGIEDMDTTTSFHRTFPNTTTVATNPTRYGNSDDTSNGGTMFIVTIGAFLGLLGLIALFLNRRREAFDAERQEEEKKETIARQEQILKAINKTTVTISENNIHRRTEKEKSIKMVSKDSEATKDESDDDLTHSSGHSRDEDGVSEAISTRTGEDSRISCHDLGEENGIAVTVIDIEAGIVLPLSIDDSEEIDKIETEEKSEVMCVEILDTKRRVADTCAICLEVYKAGDEVALSTNPACPHAYHPACICDWLFKLSPKTSWEMS